MGTTTSQTTDDVDAIIHGMSRAPPALDPTYRPPLPPQLGPPQIQPRPAPASAFGPGAFGSSQPQGGVQSWPGPSSGYGNASPPPPARSDDSGSGLTPSPYSNQPSPPATPTTPTPATPPGTQVAANRPIAPPPPRFQQGNQPGPWPAAYPNSPQINLQNPPTLPGETPQETAALNRFMGRESQGQNIINSVAAKDPRLYTQEGRTASGYWQMVNSTWATAARLAGVDIRQYPTAMSAPYQVQRQVALALYRSQGEQPWAESAENRTNVSGNPQQPLPPQPRGSEDWGSALPRDFGPGPTGQQGPFGQAANMQPGQSGFTRVLNGIGPLLLGIASLALRLPLSTAITAYGAMARAQDNGQREAYDRARQQALDQLTIANTQQTLESREASDAFVEYGANNPQGLQQTLAQIALKYNDPVMYRMAERGDLNGIHQLQTKRDLYNQDLTKLNRAAQDEQDRQAQDAAVAALDRQYQQAHPNATPDELAVAHVHNLGQVQQEFSGKQPTGDAEESTLYNVIGPDGKDTGKQVREGKTGGMRDASTGQPYTKQPGETFERAPSERPEGAGATKPSDYKDYTWDDPEGKHHGPSSAAMVPGKGLVDPMGNPIPAKPETIRTVTAATSTPAESYPHEAGSSDYPDRPNAPPPGTDITDGEWRQALTYVNTGKAPTFARDKQAMARFREIIPVAMRSMGVTEDQMDRRWVDYAAYKTRQQRIEAAFAGGQDGKTLLALNTVAHHIDLFRQYADAMRNGDVPRMNQVIDNLAREGGAPELMDFNIVSRVTGDELVRVLTGTGGGTITDREDIAHQLSAYSSPEQFEGAANTLTNVLRGRFGPLQRAYAYGDPVKEKFFQENMMEPEARRMFQGEQQPIPGADPAQRPPQPPPQQSTAPPSWADPKGKPAYLDGRTIWHKPNGKWYFDDQTLVPGQ